MFVVGVALWRFREVHQEHDFSELKMSATKLTYLSEEPKGFEWPEDGVDVEHK